MRRIVLLLAALVLVASACSSDSDPSRLETGAADDDASASSSVTDSESDGGTETASEGGDTGEAADDDPIDPTEWYSPISEFLGQDFGNFEEDEARFAALEAEAEQKITACMQGLGFEYTPRIQSTVTSFSEGAFFDDYGSDEWVATYGFGITTQRFPQSMVGPDLVGIDDEQFGGGAFGPDDDPNSEYLETLSPTAQDAYYEALYGQQPDIDPTSMSDEEIEAALNDWDPDGCANTAYDEVYAEESSNEFYEAFSDQLDELYERLEADPRIVAVQSEVGECVAERGLSWDGNMQALYERFERQLSNIGNDQFFDPFAEAGIDPDSMTQEEIEEFLESLPPPGLSTGDKAKLAALQADEIELAVAVNECGGGPRDLDDLYQEVQIELERQFLEENADALAPFAGGD